MHTVDSPYQTLLLICSSCRGDKRGPDPRALRKQLKHALGKSKSLRIAEVACLDLCPERAVAACIVDCSVRCATPRFVTVGSDDEASALADALQYAAPRVASSMESEPR